MNIFFSASSFAISQEMASDCIQKWISAKMITANQDRNIKVGTENKFPFENDFCQFKFCHYI